MANKPSAEKNGTDTALKYQTRLVEFSSATFLRLKNLHVITSRLSIVTLPLSVASILSSQFQALSIAAAAPLKVERRNAHGGCGRVPLVLRDYCILCLGNTVALVQLLE
jgi:hypothetical protein